AGPACLLIQRHTQKVQPKLHIHKPRAHSLSLPLSSSLLSPTSPSPLFFSLEPFLLCPSFSVCCVCIYSPCFLVPRCVFVNCVFMVCSLFFHCSSRSEEHTSELQSHLNLVCRLLPA